MKTTLRALAFALTLGALVGCGGNGRTKGGLEVLDAEAAIDNLREFDLGEIARTIDLTPLDGSDSDGLVGEILGMTWTKEWFYITDSGREAPVKVFDRDGGFVSTLGRYGRGQGEFMDQVSLTAKRVSLTADYDGGVVYVVGQSSGTNMALAYDASGREVMRSDSLPLGEKLAFHNSELFIILASPAPFDMVTMGNDPDFRSSIGTKVALLKVFSADMKPLRTEETVDKGTGMTAETEYRDGRLTRVSINHFGPTSALSSNGDSLLVKEAMSDTLYRYRDGALKAVWRLDFGKYTAPAGAFGLSPTVPLGDSYASFGNILESDRYLFVMACGFKDNVMRQLIFDKRDPSAGFSIAVDKRLFGVLPLDGVPVNFCGIRDGRLLGYIQAFDLVDRAADLTRYDLRAVAAGLKEDSNPVIVIAELNK